VASAPAAACLLVQQHLGAHDAAEGESQIQACASCVVAVDLEACGDGAVEAVTVQRLVHANTVLVVEHDDHEESAQPCLHGDPHHAVLSCHGDPNGGRLKALSAFASAAAEFVGEHSPDE
jgi:hypothetical protein